MRYLTLAVASDAEADRLIEDLLQHPNEPLRTPHWGNAVHARLERTDLTDPDVTGLVVAVGQRAD